MEYAIYCRKSTDESSWKQAQSIPDQIKYCIDYAKNNDLVIAKKPKDFIDFETEKEIITENAEVDLNTRKLYKETKDLFIIKEQESWKIPWKRKKWRKLIKLIEKGQIKWLLSYSPDRQARNMLEWWELIDLVDRDLIDLKYTNFYFEPTASWKMMLWIWFVFSKQYSDKLSEDTERWRNTSLNKWLAIGYPKYWYRINDLWFHEPDADNFDLMKKAFELKIYDRKSDEFIAEYLNKNWFKKKSKNKEQDASSKNLYRIWKDSFYYWMFIVWDWEYNLIGQNPYFKPLITSDEYLILIERYNGDKPDKTIKERKKENEDIYPFENWFIKTEDWFSITATIPNIHRFQEKIKGTQLKLVDVIKPNQITYRCTNVKSAYYNLSKKFDEIEKEIVLILWKIKISDEHYREYVEYAKHRFDKENKINTEERKRLQFELNKMEGKRKEYIRNNMWVKKDKEEEKIYKNEKKRFEDILENIEKQIKDIKVNEWNYIEESEAFINILQNASLYYKKANYVQKRKITNILFSNIIISPNRVGVDLKSQLEDIFNLNWQPGSGRVRTYYQLNYKVFLSGTERALSYGGIISRTISPTYYMPQLFRRQ